MRDNERLRNRLRLKETKETRKISASAICDPGLEKQKFE